MTVPQNVDACNTPATSARLLVTVIFTTSSFSSSTAFIGESAEQFVAVTRADPSGCKQRTQDCRTPQRNSNKKRSTEASVMGRPNQASRAAFALRASSANSKRSSGLSWSTDFCARHLIVDL